MPASGPTSTRRREEGPPPLPESSRRLSFAVLAVSVVTYSLIQSLLAPVLPDLQDTSQSATTWVGSLIAAAAPSIGWMIAGRVIQRLGGGVLPVSFGLVRSNGSHPPSWSRPTEARDAWVL